MDDFQEQEIHLKDYLRVLLRRKYIILLVIGISLPIIIIRAFSGDPVYQATAKLLIERDTASTTFLTNYRIGYDPGFLTTQTQIIKSKKVGRQVVEKLNLDETYSQYFPAQDNDSWLRAVSNWFHKLYGVLGKLVGGSGRGSAPGPGETVPLSEEEKKALRVDSFARMVSNGISVQSVAEEGNVVNVSFQSLNPRLAARIVNTVADAYKGFLLEMRTQSTAEALEWLKEKAAIQREALQASEKEMQQYKREQGIYTVGDRETMFPAKVADLSNRLTRVQAEVEEMESLYQEISRISLSEALNLPVVADNVTVSTLRKKIIEQEHTINALSKSIGNKHPRMIRARKDLQSLKVKMDEEIRGVIQSIKNNYELAREKANSIESLLDKTKQNAALMNDKLIQYEILKRDVDVNTLLYERLLRRIKEYDATDTSQSVDVWVVEEAATPQFPINKRPKRTLMLGFLVSLMLGVGLAFFLEYLDNTVKTAEDVEARLGHPVLGMVPLLTDDAVQMEKIVLQSPQSIIAENYKTIRTVILLSEDEPVSQSILVSSMTQATGKTVTSINLAITFAMSDRRVLLIDGDMRRPRIHSVFNVPNDSGLSTYLAGGESEIRPHQPNPDLSGLYVIPSGPVPSNPSELLSSTRLRKLLAAVGETYDFIFIDSPPILNVTDANLISKAVDQTLLVIRSGVSTYDSLRRLEAMMSQINAPILGYIVNAVDEKEQRHYYYKNYGNYYYGSDYNAERT